MDLEQIAIEAALQLGFDLKDKQMEAIVSILRGEDVLVVLPTGYGKSIIYGCLPNALKSIHQSDCEEPIVLVTAPLTAIMKDQVSMIIT